MTSTFNSQARIDPRFKLFEDYPELKDLYYINPQVHLVVDSIVRSTSTDHIISLCIQLVKINCKLQTSLEDAVMQGYRFKE